MHDSLEDFIKFSGNAKQEVNSKQNEVALTEQKKKECNARAMKVVYLLIEGKFRKESFLACLKYINPEHYQDIVEERAISKLCGYCLCGNNIPDMPQKQYHISTKLNKVYNITDRKNYCSNNCYKSSLHIKKQVDTRPLWLRNYNDCSKIELLEDSESGLPGEEIDQGLAKLPQEAAFTSVSVFTNASLDELIAAEVKAPANKTKTAVVSNPCMDTISECNEDENTPSKSEEGIVSSETQIKPKDNETEHKKVIDTRKNTPLKSEEIILSSKTQIKPEDSETEHKKVILSNEKQIKPEDNRTENKKIIVTKKNTNNTPKKKIDILKQVKKCISEWITLETLIYLHGDERIKQVLNETKLKEYFDALKIAELQTSQQIKYLDICKKLNLNEMAEERFDRAATEKALNPVPDYNELKRENQNLDVKVKSFYSGQLYEQNDENFRTLEGASDVVLPSVNTNLQRQKIFLTAANKVLQSVVDMLHLNRSEIFPAVQSLVKTFNLQAHNVVFKPPEWNIIVIAFLEILSIRYKNIQVELQNEHCDKFTKLLLQNLPGHETFVDDVLKMVSNVDQFVEGYVTGNN